MYSKIFPGQQRVENTDSRARHQVVVAIAIRTDDHVTVVVAFQNGDLTQQDNSLVAGGEAAVIWRSRLAS